LCLIFKKLLFHLAKIRKLKIEKWKILKKIKEKQLQPKKMVTTSNS